MGRMGGSGGRAVCIWPRTLSVLESQALWQVREAVCFLLLECLQSFEPAPRSQGGGIRPQQQPAACFSPGTRGPLGGFFDGPSPLSILQPSLWEAPVGHLLECPMGTAGIQTSRGFLTLVQGRLVTRLWVGEVLFY